MRLKELRLRRNFSQIKVAMDLNMNQNSVSRYENGERTPSYQTICFIAQKFNTTPDYLYGMSDNYEPNQISISFYDEPDLYELVCICREKQDFVNRLLEYIKKGGILFE